MVQAFSCRVPVEPLTVHSGPPPTRCAGPCLHTRYSLTMLKINYYSAAGVATSIPKILHTCRGVFSLPIVLRASLRRARPLGTLPTRCSSFTSRCGPSPRALAACRTRRAALAAAAPGSCSSLGLPRINVPRPARARRTRSCSTAALTPRRSRHVARRSAATRRLRACRWRSAHCGSWPT